MSASWRGALERLVVSIGAGAAFGLPACAFARQDTFVIVTLDSPVGNQRIDPGRSVEWTLAVEVVSAGRDFGLAGLVTDLVMSDYPALPPNNPFQPSTVPAGMERFSRPLGISNPPPPGWPESPGYGGTPAVIMLDLFGSPFPAFALLEVGGLQNSFGVSGGAVGTETACLEGVAQGDPQVVATGSFPAPGRPGHYVVELQHLVANVFSFIATAPIESRVQQVSGEFWWYDTPADDFLVSNWGFVFDVECRADLTGDGLVGVEDLFAFLALYFQQAPSADFDHDGHVSVNDLFVFLALFFTGCA